MTLALHIQKLNKLYKNSTEKALDNVSFSIKKGEFVALLGPNGAGKSTLINIIASNVIKNSGEITLFGYDFDKNALEIKKIIGIVPQEVTFDDFFTVQEVLEFQSGYFGIRDNAKHIEDTLKKLSLYEHRNKNTHALSGGMKRRLLIAKALIHKPQFCILDEPTAGVDIDLKNELYDYLKELHQEGMTIILTTHYLEEAEFLCDRIIILNHGEIIADEDKMTLMQKVGNMAHIRLQFSEDVTKKDFTCLPSYDYTFNNSFLSISLSKSDIPKFLQVLNKNNLEYRDIKITEERLEDVFRKLVNT
jgi:ABC-2 type transport system ATP-binding protein